MTWEECSPLVKTVPMAVAQMSCDTIPVNYFDYENTTTPRMADTLDCLVDKKVVKYFPEWKLTENVQERLASLFAIKEKWTMEEIAPFVEKLTAPKLNVNALLTKYSRVSMINGVKHFSSKHGK